MDAVKFMKEKERMCKRYSKCTVTVDCPLRKPMDEHGLTCLGYCFAYPEEAVAVLEKWSAEHPVKTRQSEFLKIIPDATVRNGVIDVRPCQISDKMNKWCAEFKQCSDCIKKYWLAEVE